MSALPQRLATPADAPRLAELYRALGFRETSRGMLTMPDGVTLKGVAMERSIARAR